MKDKVKALNNQTHFVQGVDKLDKLRSKRPRAALHSANKNKIHKDK